MATAARPADAPGLVERLAAIVGPAHVLTEEVERRFYATDVLRAVEVPLAVVRPGSVDELAAVVRVAAEARAPVVVRGGGASYTDGYTHARPGGVTVDPSRLKAITVDATNAVVTVEAGVTWAELRDALLPHELRTPFFGPFSGLAATVAGSMSQHSISHGTGIWGVSAESLVGFDVVTGTGELLSTGTPFFRFYGPDLAGLFTGDCGAFGIKARVRLKLIRRRPHYEALSFDFARFEALHEAMRRIAVEALDDENFGLDATLQQGQIGRQKGVAAKADIAARVWKGEGSLTRGVRTLARMAVAGEKDLKRATYAVHYIAEGVTPAEARDRAARIRELAVGQGAVEIPNSVPTVVRSMPFAPLTNVLGPKGERWVPFHTLLPHDRVAAFHAELEAYFAEQAPVMERFGITSGRMFMSVGPNAFVYEPTFYWPDARSIYHERTVPPDHLAGLPQYPDNPAARAEALRMKAEIIALMARHGGAHLQVGRVYPWLASRDAPSRALVQAIKAALDPHGILNPGALGLD
ncbi:MAG: FAD-binding oxidoreductase [Sphingomonadaceae bacterium]|uniref:FAD-binding oxidoreductase n=1 Tax=Thermaurantiacus sp. TaxID=2820283 RepID=UPI00298F035F|nr:FAD-binding oxidoreductase [Thermaurantiacus sp.]MCS6987580.1 FAD-binding oxidoreductase [Sphingomonadaceae bacterium]MDW8415181.1 FAD-binding oxidoreductase [Thermaurantiacus sp.]